MRKEIMRITDLCAEREAGCSLNHVCMQLYEGEVLGIAGLHDAGKTFLFDCIMGERKVKTGRIYINEEVQTWEYGGKKGLFYRIRKKSSLIENCTVLENLFIISKKKRPYWIIRWKKIETLARICLEEFKISVDIHTKISDLSLEQRNEIEILKAYIMGCRLILIDDILSIYGAGDSGRLYELIRQMQAKNVSFLMAGCQMEKIKIFTDRCLYMANGWAVKNVENIKRKQLDESKVMFWGKDARNEHGSDIDMQLQKHKQNKMHAPQIAADVQYGENGKRIRMYRGEILVFLDINHAEALKLMEDLRKKKRENIEIEGKVWKKTSDICVTDFLNTQPLIHSLSLCDNLCLALYSRISCLGFISKKKAAVVERFFLEQYQHQGWKEMNSRYLSFAKKLAVFLERLKLQKWKVMFCFNLENIMTYEVEMMIKEQLLKMTESKRSICIFASSFEHFKDFPDYYLIDTGDGNIERYTYAELKSYLGYKEHKNI